MVKNYYLTLLKNTDDTDQIVFRDKVKPSKYNRGVVVSLAVDTTTKQIGYCICAPGDNFKKKYGRMKSIGMLNQAKAHNKVINGPNVVATAGYQYIQEKVHDFVTSQIFNNERS